VNERVPFHVILKHITLLSIFFKEGISQIKPHTLDFPNQAGILFIFQIKPHTLQANCLTTALASRTEFVDFWA
jgi:hypothetical protein